jgi:hypothetical protein
MCLARLLGALVRAPITGFVRLVRLGGQRALKIVARSGALAPLELGRPERAG